MSNYKKIDFWLSNFQLPKNLGSNKSLFATITIKKPEIYDTFSQDSPLEPPLNSWDDGSHHNFNFFYSNGIFNRPNTFWQRYVLKFLPFLFYFYFFSLLRRFLTLVRFGRPLQAVNQFFLTAVPCRPTTSSDQPILSDGSSTRNHRQNILKAPNFIFFLRTVNQTSK